MLSSPLALLHVSASSARAGTSAASKVSSTAAARKMTRKYISDAPANHIVMKSSLSRSRYRGNDEEMLLLRP
jgi:hypothetical protein